VTSVAWGLWEPAGRYAEVSRRQGLPPLDPEAALAALGEILDRDEPAVTVADVDWEVFAPLFTLARPSSLLKGVPTAARALEGARETAEGDGAAELRRELAGRPEAERVGRLEELVRTHVAIVLRYGGSDVVEADRPFRDLGFDSIAAVELRNRLRAATGMSLSSTAAFDHPTPRALAVHLAAGLLPEEQDPAQDRLTDLETALSALTADDPRRAGLVNRLRALVWKYGELSEDAGPEGDLTTATADEMFALLDQELGS
jgi:acyl carrier protein